MNWQKILKSMLTSKVFFLTWVERLPLIASEIMILDLVKTAKDTYMKFNRLPTFDELKYAIENSALADAIKTKAVQLLKESELLVISADDIDGCNAVLEQELTRQGLEKLTLDIAQNIQKYSFEDVYNKLKSASLEYKSSNAELGIDIKDLQRTLSMVKFREGEKVSTGIEALDATLYGGFGTNELFTIMAHSGKGKTATLVNLMYGALLNGFDVAYFTLEMSARDILRRFYRRITYKTKNEFHDDEKKWTTTIERFFKLTKTSGRILYYPTGTIGVFDIEMALDRLRDLYDFQPKVVIVDHIDLLKPPKVGYRMEHWTALKLITDNLRNIALTRNMAIVTATQATKASFNKIKLTQSDIGESYGKIQSSDVVVALCQTDEELTNHRMRLVFVKNRDYVAGREIETYIDLDKMLITDTNFAKANGWIS